MRHYETIYIINPNLSDEEVEQVNEKFKALIESQKGVVIKLQDWGKQRLAYEIKKYDKGTYFLVDFCGQSGLTSELARNLKLDERILKFQTVKLEDYADPQELIKKEEEKHQESKSEEEAPSQEEDQESEIPEKEEIIEE
jgi:small subunit ribosomal protein S6